MVLCRRPLLFASDALGAAGIVIVIGALLLGAILPLQRAVQARPGLHDELSGAQDRYDVATGRNRVLGESIRTLENRFAELSVPRHSDTGEFLKFVSGACAAAGFELQQLTPQDVDTKDAAHRSWDAQMRATGAFAAFPRLLAEIEAWSPFVHIRDLSVSGPPDAGAGGCQFSWTVRVNYLPSAPGPKEAPPK